jgi:hypothetical protein
MNCTEPAGMVHLHTDEAADLADTLSFLQDWLRRASDDALADLADYIDTNTLPGAVNDVTGAFITGLGALTVTLRQRIQQVQR